MGSPLDNCANDAFTLGKPLHSWDQRALHCPGKGRIL
jgi:hypothetical protein